MNQVLEIPQIADSERHQTTAWSCIDPALAEFHEFTIQWTQPRRVRAVGHAYADTHQSVTMKSKFRIISADEQEDTELTAWLRDISAPETNLGSTVKQLRASGDAYVYPGGKRPTEQAFDDAELFVANLPKLRLYSKIGLVADGEINFLWKHGGVHVDLGFYGEAEGSYYARDKNGKEYFCDGFPASEGLPGPISSIVS